MFRRLWPLAVLGLLLVPVSIQGQDAARTDGYASGTDLTARIDSLRPLVEQSRAAVEARAARADEIDRLISASIARVDTLRIGQVTILTPVEQSVLARDVFETVWTEHFDGIGESPALENAVFVFQWADDRVPIHTSDSRSELIFDRWVRRSVVEVDVRNAIGSAMTFDLGIVGSQVGRWVASNPMREHDMADLYVQLVTSPSIVTRACIDGDVDACASAMGLGLDQLPGSSSEPWAPDNPDVVGSWKRFSAEQMRLWYAPEERQAIAGSISGRLPARAREARDRCLTADVYDACDSLLGDYFDYLGNLVPLGGAARGSLIAHALELGGRNAWERAIADPQMTPEEVLEYTAGMPLHDIVEGWRGRLVAARPVAHGSLVPSGVLALLWTLFFGALAMRSTRWRLR